MIDIGTIFSTVLTLFIILLIGFGARKIGIVDWKSTKRIASLLVNVTQPMLILCAFQTAFTSEKLVIGMQILLASAIIHIVIAVFAAFLFRSFEKSMRTVLEFGLVFGECVYLGYPVLSAIFGPTDGLFYGACYTIFHNVFLRTFGVYLLSKDSKDSAPLRRAIFNPGTLASLLGIVLFLLKITLPAFLLEPISLVGGITYPLSMLVLGSLLCNQPFAKTFQPQIFLFSLVKLILLPLLTLAFCLVISLDKGMTYIIVSMCCLPASVNTAIFSELYRKNPSVSAGCVSVSVLGCILTIPGMLWLTRLAFQLLGR